MVRGVVVLEVAVPLDGVVEDLDRAIEVALAEGPRGVVCDLSSVPESDDPGERLAHALDLLASAGRHVRDWPAIPVAVVSPDSKVRAALNAHPLGSHLIVSDSLLSALSQVLGTPTPAVDRLRLAPHPTAPRAAREFISRALLDRGLGRTIPSASLVISELVTNSTMYAGTDISMSIGWHREALRLSVRDNDPTLPHQRERGLDPHGRGLTIVGGLSRAYGVLPTADGGKVVWAVLDAPRPNGADAPRPNGAADPGRAGSPPAGS